ncbi:MAG: helix-hairpin-helix domain-containing protein [Nostoc sp.]
MSTPSNLSPQQVSAFPQHETITGVVERLTFYSAESGYTVARLTRPRSTELTTIVGSFANIQPGQTLQLTGFWRDHPQFGPQFQVVNYKETKPATLTGIEKYLGSGLIKGVGPVTAKRIVAHFGLETLDIIENQIERLIEVQGIAKKRITLIKNAWSTQKAIKEVMVFLQGHGVSTTYAVKIYKQYKDEAIATVTKNPYQLAADIYGIGFLTADKIARNIGIAPDSEFRYRAGIMHCLSVAAEDGHCYLPQSELIESVIKLLTTESHQPTEEGVAIIIKDMALVEELIRERDEEKRLLCYKPTYFHTEQNLAQLIRQRLENPVDTDIERVRDWIDRFTASRKIQLSEQQRQAQQSAIITAAHQINRGIYPTIEPISDNPVSDCIWHGGGHQPEHGVQAICELITDLIPRLGFNPATDVQVLCPMTRGVVGTRNLNTVLQQLINPPSPSKVEINRGGNLLREGDRIIQLTNDYNREVFNGDLGIIQNIDTVEQEVTVQYGERAVVYDYADLNEIALAWSISIHKSQGSEYPVIVLPIYMQHYMMLTRNLFYTGITRAKKLAIEVGAKKAISLAVRSTDDQRRYTRLQQRLLHPGLHW